MDPVWRPYVLAQLPGWAIAALAAFLLVRSGLLGLWLASALVGVLVVKDLLLFPWMRRFYSSDPATRRILGERGTAVTTIEQTGFVRVHGELWQARSERRIPEGAPVRVRDVHGLELRVDVDYAPPDGERAGPQGR